VQTVRAMIDRLSGDRLRRDLFHLCKDPIPYRKINHTLPGHAKHTLDEADDYIVAQLEACGYTVEKQAVPVQARERDESKPKAQQYGPASGPWMAAYNLNAVRVGSAQPDETIVFVAHKDSQSWVDSPGAYDNGVGTVALIEMARALSENQPRRSFWFLWCNEEHAPWTSIHAAEVARDRGDNLIAVLNMDGIGGRPDEDVRAGRRTNVTLYTEPEGERIADLMSEVNDRYRIGLTQTKGRRSSPGDDDGSFIRAGFPTAVINIGSWHYAEPSYHRETDVPENVDTDNVLMATQAAFAAALTLDAS